MSRHPNAPLPAGPPDLSSRLRVMIASAVLARQVELDISAHSSQSLEPTCAFGASDTGTKSKGVVTGGWGARSPGGGHARPGPGQQRHDRGQRRLPGRLPGQAPRPAGPKPLHEPDRQRRPQKGASHNHVHHAPPRNRFSYMPHIASGAARGCLRSWKPAWRPSSPHKVGRDVEEATPHELLV